MKRTAVGLLAIALALGCATRGNRFDVDSVDRIVPGVTSQEDVQRWFGTPARVRRSGNGRTRWGYQFVETETRSTRTITRIFRSIGSIFGWRWFVPPVNLTYEKSTRHSLTVMFDPRGVVADYNYEREITPSKRIN